MADLTSGTVASARTEPPAFDPFADTAGDDSDVFSTPSGTGPDTTGGIDGGFITVNPETLSGTSSAGTGGAEAAPRKRGPKPGTKRQARPATANLSEAIASGLFWFHQALKTGTNIPEFELTIPEAQALGAACDRVLAEYIDTTVSRKASAWMNLAGVLTGTYGGRILHYKARTVGAKKVSPPQPTAPSGLYQVGA